jgi:hypothetical protein
MQVVSFSSSRRSLFPLTIGSRPPGGSVRTRRGTRADDSRVCLSHCGVGRCNGSRHGLRRPSQHLSLHQHLQEHGRVALPRIGFGIADDRPVLRLSMPNTRGYRRGADSATQTCAICPVLPCSPWSSSPLMIRPAPHPSPHLHEQHVPCTSSDSRAVLSRRRQIHHRYPRRPCGIVLGGRRIAADNGWLRRAPHLPSTEGGGGGR